jgi:hypothetical protein
MEENQVEQTTETNEEAQQVEDNLNAQGFTQDQVTEIVRKRLAQERSQIYKKLGVEDIGIAVNAVKSQKDLEEKQKIQKGEFEEILKNKTQEWNTERSNLEAQLKDIKINKSLLSSASKNKAVNPDQVVSLLQSQIKLNESGNAEVLDSKGLPRYNNKGELFTTDELVQEFLTHNPHFVSATPSGSGSVSNVDRIELNKPLNLSDLDMNNPADRKQYAEFRKQRDSKTRTIVVNN